MMQSSADSLPQVLLDDRSEADVCFRCGYDLRGMADAAPCPQCGLQAGRSRMPTEELKHARPRWLAKLSLGMWFIIIAQVGAIVWNYWAPQSRYIFNSSWVNFVSYHLRLTAWKMDQHVCQFGFDAAALIFFCGTIWITWPEGRPDADHIDRVRRVAIRVFSFIFVLATVAMHYYIERKRWLWQLIGSLDTSFLAAITFPLVPFPLLLFRQLRHLAHRVLSAHLAEHCAIVGYGMAGTFLFGPLILLLANSLGRSQGDYWTTRSPVSLMILLAVGVAGGLFYLWTLYVSIRFAGAFWRARKQAVDLWRRADLSESAEH